MSKEKTMRSCKSDSFFQCGNMAKIVEISKALKEVGASKRGDGFVHSNRYQKTPIHSNIMNTL
jgi:hypothetical protein